VLKVANLAKKGVAYAALFLLIFGMKKIFDLFAMSFARISLVGLFCIAALAGCNSSSEDLVAKANSALKAGDVKAALLHAKSAVSADTNSLKARYVLADSMRLSGDFQGLDEQLRRQLELGGERDSIIPQIALWMLDRNENAKLVNEFGKTKLNVADEQGKLAAIVTMANIGLRRIKDADLSLQAAGTINPATQLAAAQLKFHQGLQAEGTALLVDAERLAIDAGGTKWWVWRGIARMRQALGNSEQSIQSFKAALKAQPAHFGIKGELGEYYMVLGRLNEAKAILKDLQSSAPNYFRTLTMQAMFALQDGNSNLAYDMASKILAQLPDSDSAAMIVASIDLTRNNLVSAQRQGQLVVQRNPNNSSAQKLLSIIEAKKGNLKGAVKMLEEAAQRLPNDMSLKVELARQTLALGNRAEAQKLLNAVIATEPSNVGALVTVAELALLNADNEKASVNLKNALASVQGDFTNLQPLFDLSIRATNYDLAQAVADKLKVGAPDDPHVYLWQAIVAQAKKQPVQAQEFLVKSLERDAAFYPSLSILKAQAVVSKDKADALEYEKRLTAAVEARPSDGRIYIDMLSLKRAKRTPSNELANFAKSYAEQQIYSVQLREIAANILVQDKRQAEADELIKKGVERLSSTPNMLELGTRWAENAGQPLVALERIQMLTLANPDNVSYQVKRGQLLLAATKNDEALSVFRKASQARPDNDLIVRELAFALLKTGNKKEALDVVAAYGNLSGKKSLSLLVLADVHYFLKEYPESLQVIEDAIKLESSERTVGAKIRFHDMRNETAKSEATLASWLASDTNKPSALLFATARAANSGNRQSSVEYLSKLVAMSPGNPYMLNDLAFAQASLAKKESLIAARKAAALLPTNPKVLDTLALAQLVNDQSDAAEQTLRFAISQDPDSIAPMVRLAEVLVAKKSSGEASAIINKLDPAILTDAYKKRIAALKLG
jgi:putative PEP-CTERM system TPR-repeat lipoprotein